MKISTKGRYALRLMIDVAVHGGEEFVSLKDVAARQGISMKYLEQIAGLLGKAGFLRSGRGALGGISSDPKAPEEYTLGSILRLTEGNLAPVACLETEENACERCGVCPTLDFWTGLYAAVNDICGPLHPGGLWCGRNWRNRGERPDPPQTEWQNAGLI